MPLRAFFTMYQQGMKIEAYQFREQLDIAMAPSMKLVYYKSIREKYNNIIYKNKGELPKRPPDMHIDAASSDAQEIMRGLFGSMKRGMGYG